MMFSSYIIRIVILAVFILGLKTSSKNVQQFKYKNYINNILQRC